MPIAETYPGGRLSLQEIAVLVAEFEPGPPERILRWANEELAPTLHWLPGLAKGVLIDMLTNGSG